MTTQQKIEGLYMELKHGYNEETVRKIHILQNDLDNEKKKDQPKPKIYGEDIRPLTAYPNI